MALFQIMDNDSVAVSVPRKATEEEKIGNNLLECQAVIMMTNQKETGRDSNQDQEDKGAEDTGKEGFGVNGESGLDDTEVCASGSNVGETGEEDYHSSSHSPSLQTAYQQQPPYWNVNREQTIICLFKLIEK